MVGDLTIIKKVECVNSLVIDGEMYDDNIDDDKKPKKIFDTGIISLKRTTETGEALQDLNATGRETESKMSKIDLRSVTTDIQASALTKLDVLCELGVLPPDVQFLSVQAKRNFVSVKGRGRDQIVETAVGVNSKQQGRGILSKFTGMFSGGNSANVGVNQNG